MALVPDPVEEARLAAWQDALGDGLMYRFLLDERGIQHPTDRPLPDSLDRTNQIRMP